MHGQFVWLDGIITPWEQATVSVMTNTLHYGSGAFEGIRCYATDKGPAIFRLSDHIDRLLTSFSCFNAVIPWTKAELEQAVIETVKINKLTCCYIRPIIFFGGESLLLDVKPLSVHCAIIAIPLDKYLGDNAIKVGISSIRRISPTAVPIHNKISGFYVNSMLAHQEIKRRGFDEALLLDDEGNVAEGSIENVFFVIDGILTTPPATFILPGITRASIIEIASSLGIPTREKTVTLEDTKRATEVFFTGTASEITPINTIEQHQYKTAPSIITQQLQKTYKNIIQGNNSAFDTWLTYIA